MFEIKSRSLTLLKGLGISFCIFSVSRIVYFIFNFNDFAFYPIKNLVWAFTIGIWFDSVPVFYYNILFIFILILPHPWFHKNWFKQLVIWTFLFGNSIATFQNFIDSAYFPYNKKRTGAEIFLLSKEWNTSQLLSYALDFWYMFLLFFIVIYISYLILQSKLFSLSAKNQGLKVHKNFIFSFFQWAGFILITVGITLIGMRGGIGLIPLRTFDASRYVNMALVPLAVNTPLQLISTIESNTTPEFNFMEEREALEIIKPERLYNQSAFEKKNVVIIIVESLGKEYMGFYNNGKGYTPFLDSLCHKSLTFNYSFANGTTSMDAPPALFSGIANLLDDSYIISRHNTNSPCSIGKLLAKQGYNSSFYHAGENGTMGFDNFISLAKMGEYYGLDDYPNKKDYDGLWGIFDEPYLSYYADELTQKKQPFVSSVFTLSSHHPYTIPEKYKNKLPQGTIGIHKSIAYADLSLKNFFLKCEKLPWFNNTLFVITGDHTSDSENPLYQTPTGRYAVPFIFYCPRNNGVEEKKDNVMQQSILLPTIMDYLHYPSSFNSLGNSALRNGSYAIFYSGGSYTMLQNNHALVMSPSRQTYLYDYVKDPYMQNEIGDNSILKQNMDLTLKSYLQLFVKQMKEDAF